MTQEAADCCAIVFAVPMDVIGRIPDAAKKAKV